MKGVEYFMKLPDQLKDIVYRLLQEPTLDNFRNFLKGQTGEHNSIDFKEKWIEPTKLVTVSYTHLTLPTNSRV